MDYDFSRSSRNSGERRASRPTEISISSGAVAGGAGRKALIVGADPATLRLCTDVLAGSGFTIEVVESGMEAVIAARRLPPELIFVAAQLRDVPGREAVHWLRSNPALQATPVVMLAADSEVDARASAAGPIAVLRKPHTAAAIRQVIADMLR